MIGAIFAITIPALAKPIIRKYQYEGLTIRLIADFDILWNQLEEIINERKYNEFRLGELYGFDVSDFDKVDYQPFLRELKQ